MEWDLRFCDLKPEIQEIFEDHCNRKFDPMEVIGFIDWNSFIEEDNEDE